MKKCFLIVTLLYFSIISFSQNKFVISGYCTDEATGEVLVGTNIVDATSQKGTTSNEYGFYSLELTNGNHSITYFYLGYEKFVLEVDINTNIRKDIKLKPTTISLETVTITETYKKDIIKSNEFSIEQLTYKDIAKLPTLIGEADVIKAIQMQPGVKILGDASAGMFIRGGSSDQNLILIDEAPIYNPSHLFGFISVFNSDAINHIGIYKSNMPAQYGGRVSSVIDAKMKEGNMHSYDFAAGINPFAASFTANGPIKKDVASFLISGRKSLVDLFFKPNEGFNLVPGFYDINLKLNTKIGENDRIFLSGYFGNDIIKSFDGFYNKWGNGIGTLRWNRNFGTKFFSNVTAIYSSYQNYLEFKEDKQEYKWHTGLTDVNLKLDLSYFIKPDNTLKFGAGVIYHQFIPGETENKAESIARSQALEYSVYAQHDVLITKWLGVNYGLRASIFQNVGEGTWFETDEIGKITDTHTNKKGVYNTYWNLEPRASINFHIHQNYSFKIAYARNAQYLQVLQNNTASYASLETWFPATPNIEPIVVDVFSAGWFQRFLKDYFVSVEFYYKNYLNQIDYVDHAKLVNNPHIITEIRKGTARAYGIELSLKKDIGKFTGNVSYTYSRAFRTIEGINAGEEYSSPYDIPHDVRITGHYKLSDKWGVSANWIFMSGRPVTLPIGFYYMELNSQLVPIYSDRNSSRFPNYHRLDIAATFTANVKKSLWNLNFGFYNVYARRNPLAFEFTPNSDNPHGMNIYQLSLFTIMPNVSLKINF